MIARPSGWSPNTASPSRSKTFSCGSSSYIAISSRITARSESISLSVGRKTMSADHVERLGHVVVDHARVDRGRLLAGSGVQLGAHPVEDLVDLERAVFRGALEQQMLEQVRQPGVLVVLGPGAGADPEPDRYGSDRGHRLGHDPYARIERGQPVLLEHRRLLTAVGIAIAHATAASPARGRRRGGGAGRDRGHGVRGRRGRVRPVLRCARGAAGRCRRSATAASSSTVLPTTSGSFASRRPIRPRSRSTSTTRTSSSSPLLSTSSTERSAGRAPRWRCGAGRRCPWRARRTRRTRSS